jgi:hypothetical protein
MGNMNRLLCDLIQPAIPTTTNAVQIVCSWAFITIQVQDITVQMLFPGFAELNAMARELRQIIKGTVQTVQSGLTNVQTTVLQQYSSAAFYPTNLEQMVNYMEHHLSL